MFKIDKKIKVMPFRSITCLGFSGPPLQPKILIESRDFSNTSEFAITKPTRLAKVLDHMLGQ